jgi:3-hydroxyisobutyrate dehydrogenase-like beta-hydroxyacid dehydrogenase
MKITSVAIISPGEMGSAIGRLLSGNGIEVLTCLESRSDASRLRAERAGFQTAETIDDLLRGVDLVLSVVPPDQAVAVAERVAASLASQITKPVFAECNAIAPQTALRIGEKISARGAVFIDAGIIGAPPRPDGRTRLYCSGPDTRALEAISVEGLEVRVVGPEIGQASGLKMVYSASTKGTTALWAQLLIAAKALGLDEALMHEFSLGGRQTIISQQVMEQIPPVPRNSTRWIGEMDEIAATFAALGLSPKIFEGVAELYRFIATTPLATENDGSNVPADNVIEELTNALHLETKWR